MQSQRFFQVLMCLARCEVPRSRKGEVFPGARAAGWARSFCLWSPLSGAAFCLLLLCVFTGAGTAEWWPAMLDWAEGLRC